MENNATVKKFIVFVPSDKKEEVKKVIPLSIPANYSVNVSDTKFLLKMPMLFTAGMRLVATDIEGIKNFFNL